MIAIVVVVFIITASAFQTHALAQNAPSTYAVIEINAPGSSGTVVNGTANDDFVVGYSQFGHGSKPAFAWHNGDVTMLQSLDDIHPNPFCNPRDLNSYGWAVGQSGTNSGALVPALWIAGIPTNLGTLGGANGEAWSINDLDSVVGNADDANGLPVAFIWRDNQMTQLGTLGGNQSYALGINNRDEVTGYALTAENQWHAFLWRDQTMTDLGTLGGTSSWGEAINDSAQIAGYSWRDANQIDEAFIWTNGEMQSIQGPGYQWSIANGINHPAIVVGAMNGDGPDNSDAFVWDATNGMRNVESLIAPDSGWDFTSARDINDGNQIVCEGVRHGKNIGALLTPVSPSLQLDDPSSHQAGSDVTLTVHGADPGERIMFVYGRIGGGYQVPACDYTSGAVFEMDDPTVIGSSIANKNGDASITVFVPIAARHAGDILLQAVEQSRCRISELVVTQFQ